MPMVILNHAIREAANMQYFIRLDSAIKPEIMERNWLQHASWIPMTVQNMHKTIISFSPYFISRGPDYQVIIQWMLTNTYFTFTLF